jgi:hypothetical protein
MHPAQQMCVRQLSRPFLLSIASRPEDRSWSILASGRKPASKRVHCGFGRRRLASRCGSRTRCEPSSNIDASYYCFVAAVSELQQAEAVAERIGHERDTAPIVGVELALDDCACRLSSLNRRAKVIHGDVEVNRRPVPALVTQGRKRH